MKRILKQYWFLLAIVICVLLAELYPSLGKSGGILRPEITVKYGSVGLIYLISGLSLNINDILLAARKYKLHCFVQLFTFLCIPIIISILNVFLKMIFGVNEWILKGLTTISCMPPPVSSAIIFTRAIGGNEAAAVFNSVIGSLLGVILTPMMLLFFLGSTVVMSMLNPIVVMGQTVIVPLLVGLALRHFRLVRNLNRLPLPVIGQFLLLTIIYTAFCDAFVRHDAPMNAADILVSIILVVLIQIGLLYITFHTSYYFRWYTPADIVAITFCSTHKSLTLGISILTILFSGYAHFSQITLPLLIYHLTQIALGGLMVAPFKKWLVQNRSKMKILP